MSVIRFLFPVFVSMFSAAIAPLATAQSRPNILLIFADDVGSDAIGCYGGQSYPTPHIDSLASGGMKFTHAFSMPVCHPSRICLMTGRYPFRFGDAGMRWGDYPETAEGRSIGNRMKAAGYTTAVAGKWQLCLMKNDLRQPARTGFDHWCLFGWHEGARYHDPFLYQDGRRREDTAGKYGPDLYVDFLTDFVRQARAAGTPFFAYYSMALCHDVTDDLKDRHVAYYKHGRWMTYAEMVSSMDDCVGRLIDALDAMGAREETLIVFTTDNGTPAATYLYVDDDGKMVRPRVYSARNGHVIPGGKGKHSDTGTRVPLIANWPGRIRAGSVSDAMVDLTDYLPTFMELAGSQITGGERPVDALDGISFAPLLFGQPRSEERDWVYCEHRGKRSIRSRHYRLHEDGALFDLRGDPVESSPVDPSRITPQQASARDGLRETLRRLEPGG